MTRYALCLVALVLGAAWMVGNVGAVLAQWFIDAGGLS